MTDVISRTTITLPEFIRKGQDRHPAATGDLTTILLNIALGTKIVSRGVNMAGIGELLGLTGETNVQGESVQKLDEYSDRVFASTLGRGGDVLSMVSEERESLFADEEASRSSNYVIAFDPLDGSSNIDVNVAIGTIWGIYRRTSHGSRVDPRDMRDFLQPGSAQVAAGYAVYGSSTMFVYATADSLVNGFTLDPTIGEFVLTHPDMKIPEDGKIYSCNEGNYMQWARPVREYVDSMRAPEIGPADKPRFSARYVGSLVADFHRTMLKGGIFMYPADRKNTEGKLRLLYECAPLAFIVEKAGGRATDGFSRIVEKTPQTIHQRTPFFIGSRKMVERFEQRMRPE